MRIFRQLNETTVITLVSAAVLFIILLPFALRTMSEVWWFTPILVSPILIGYYYRKQFSPRMRSIVIGLLLAVTVVYSFRSVYVMYFRNVADPPVWDFQCFWINGRVGADGLDFYDAENFHALADRYLEPDEFFSREFLDPAFVYPPPTMFLFIPLGWFNIHEAMVLWNTVQLGFAALSAWLLWTLFFKDDGIEGLLFVTALMASFYATHLTLTKGQLNFMMLSTLLLALRDQDHPRTGVWLALGIIFKPLVGALLLLFILKRQWRVLWVTMIMLGGISLLSIAVFGLDNFTPYFLDSPTAKLPDDLYLQWFYQSLYSIVTKFLAASGIVGLGVNQAFLVPALAIVITSIWLVIRMGERAWTVQYALILMMAMLLYPHTQVYYGILILAPIAVMWQYKTDLKLWQMVALVTAAYTATASISQGGIYVFISLLCLWFACVYLAFRLTLQGESETPVQFSPKRA